MIENRFVVMSQDTGELPDIRQVRLDFLHCIVDDRAVYAEIMIKDLYNKIQQVYSAYFKPETPYMQGSFKYANATNYGYVGFEQREYDGRRELTADEYVALSGTHCDHMVIPEPYKRKFFDGLREAVLEAGNKIVFSDTFILYLAKKPLL